MTEKTRAETREKFANETYPIHVIGRHVSVTEPMKAYVIDKLRKIERFGGHVIDATIVMDVQKLVHSVDIIVNVNNTKIKVSGLSDDMYASSDMAIHRLKSKLARYIERLHEHHAKKLTDIDMNVNVIGRISMLDDINDQIEEENLKRIEADQKPHTVVSQEKVPLKVLNQSEAVMRMELSEDVFLLYKSEEDGKLKVIYRRNDGHYGIIEPQK